MKLKFLLLIGCLAFNLTAMAQFKFGFELNTYSSTLKNISPDTVVGHGHSGAVATPDKFLRVSPSLVVRQSFGKRFSLESGVGYVKSKHGVRLEYNYTNDYFYRQPIDDTLNTTLAYIQVPFLVIYSFPLQENLKLNLSTGLKTRFLVSYKDNYQDIIFEQFGLHSSRYNKIVYAPTFGIKLEKKLLNGQMIELGFSGSYNANSLVNEEVLWGFFHNLYPAKNQELGLTVKFFL